MEVIVGLGQLTTEYQAHSGAVNTSTSPKVQYAYSLMSGGANNSRPTSVTYPGGFVLSYNYGAGGGLNDAISRLNSMTDVDGTVESYKYLGLGTVVERDFLTASRQSPSGHRPAPFESPRCRAAWRP